MSDNNEEFLDLTVSVVSAYVANNNVPAGDLTALIASIHSALSKLGGAPEAPAAAPLVPAVSIRKSVTPEAIICLEDGKPFKSLKRHLSNKYGLTPEQYRTKWGLPVDYPMVAPAYSEARSALAKAAGLGRKSVAAPDPVEPVKVAKAKRTAKAKA
jgi:predicted transcriptional regulator